MIGNLFKFRIPTILGLGIIVIGLLVGVYLTLQNQTILTKAAPQTQPENITISNIEGDSVTISWTTEQKVTGLVKFGVTSVDENTALDDRDKQGSPARNLHFITIRNLSPQTTYQYKIISGKTETSLAQFTTSANLEPNNLKPITGSVLDGEQPLAEGLVYLKIPDQNTLSTTVKSLGNFIIPLTYFQATGIQTTILEVISEDGRKAAATINLINDGPIGPLRLGQDLDLTKQIIKAAANLEFDLNSDGVVNTSDYSLLLKNFNNPPAGGPKDRRFDLNKDGVVDKKDADLILDEIQKSGNK